jgi:chromosomal replication initiator protein
MDKEKLWKEVLGSIKVSVSPATFTTWFAQTHISSIRDSKDRFLIEIGCPSAFIRQNLENRYLGLIQDSLHKALGKPCEIVFVVESVVDKAPLNTTPLFQQKPEESRIQELLIKSGIRPSFTFDNFAVSPSNQMAWAAADAVSKNLGSAYNPLFIWGGVGIGKTHLMSAVGNRVMHENPGINILFTTGEQFTNDIVDGIRNKDMAGVRAKYRKLKLFMIDDIQFIAGKDTVQEEFFHTFNAVVGAGNQIIMTSDKPPSEISRLEERLKSRFEAGLIVDIAPPDFELRCAITQIKAKQKGLDIPMDIIQLIAGNIETPRKIEGFLVRLSSEIKIKESQISIELVENLLQKKNNSDLKLNIKPPELINAVSKYYNIGKKQLLSNSRVRSLARPRQILMYLLRIELGLAFEEVGRIVDRDHSTVMHAVDCITRLASSDVKIRGDIEGIKRIV